ncbi:MULTISPECIES: ABC transporter ATP-binding protein/permease [Paraburkholderia]|uniref:ABC transporter ATP-binding protein/permease n=1 Tax=Paraburkholderia TaxID=1822464 RepID=UPI002AB31369|nr:MULTISPECIES: ATP-binding cassette domain-containing protein [Paraburkholderia]
MQRSNWPSWIAILAYVAYTLFEVGLGAKLSFLTKGLTDALVAKQQTSYWHWLLLVALIWLVIGDGGSTQGIMSRMAALVTQWLTIHWRQFITQDLMARYVANHVYFRVEQDGDVDNVDQRIQQEVEPVCQMALSIPVIVIYSVASFSVQGWILKSISPSLFYGVLVYATAFVVVTWWMYGRLIQYQYQTTVAEADLRFGILNIRTSAETIALYKGERAENTSVIRRLKLLVSVSYATLRYNLVMGLVETGLNFAWSLVPILVLVPIYFQGKISFGAITQGTASAVLLLGAIQRLTTFISVFAMAAPHVVRIGQFMEKATKVAHDEVDLATSITSERGDRIRFRNVTLQTPGSERTLARDMTFDVDAKHSMLIIGRTGVGKSSLIRAMAGLWRNGAGSITMPPQEAVLFLPQRPYMLLGTLREQMLYPDIEREVSDSELQRRLDQVSLPDLARQHGGFDTVIDWSRVLSLGEQQRIGFARALASTAKFVFLDEATSAVDLGTEELLYRSLLDSGVACISVGHRTSLMAFHQTVLQLLPEGRWRLLTREEAQALAA